MGRASVRRWLMCDRPDLRCDSRTCDPRRRAGRGPGDHQGSSTRSRLRTWDHPRGDRTSTWWSRKAVVW